LFLLLAGTAAIIAYFYTPRIPEASLTGYEVQDFSVNYDILNPTEGSAQFDIDIEITINNPNPVSITLSEIKFDVFYVTDDDEEIWIGDVQRETESKAKASDNTTIIVPFICRPVFSEYPTLIPEWANKVFNDEPLGIHITGNVTIPVSLTEYVLDMEFNEDVYF
jgi:LEA14-like dessication related protein